MGPYYGCRVSLKPTLLHHDRIAGAERIVERHVAVELLLRIVARHLDLALAGARGKATGNRDRRLRRHVGDVRVLAGIGDFAENEERPVGFDLDRDVRLAHIALLEPVSYTHL